MTLRADFTSQEYLRNPAGAIEKLSPKPAKLSVSIPY
jgi:hypothetical protein